VLRGYELTLDLFLKYKSVVLIAMIGTLIGTVWLYMLFQRAFFPVEDTGFINATTEGPSDHILQGMYDRQLQIADICARSAVAYPIRPLGAGGPTRPTLWPLLHCTQLRHERGENSTAVIQRLRADQRGPRHGDLFPDVGICNWRSYIALKVCLTDLPSWR